ncbi:MAG TPA: ATP-binding protein [Candidatus Polarisedimenticolia bacterium]|jgi:signal transduction histidine kinase|nr:ATP-binding protein [Candidatus Polarisedimenticolia bacterium]
MLPLDAVIGNGELERRLARAPDYQAESQALAVLMESLADATGGAGAASLMQTLAETALDLCRAHSAGVSLLEQEGGREIFRWPGAAGVWGQYVGGSIPRDQAPCGAVLDADGPLLMLHPGRHFPLAGDGPPLVECLVVPFHCAGKAVGTVWLMAHDETRSFDAEDLRLMTLLSRFAATAYQLTLAQQAGASLRGADRRKNEFLALLAHELRNPLAAIHNVVNVLRVSGGAADVTGSVFGMLERQVRQMARLVDDLLDVSRITRGRIELRRERLELAPILNQAVHDARALADALEHQLTLTLPAQPIVVDGDPSRLAQAIGNLLNNGCKVMPRGGRLAVTVEREGEQAVIRVRDHGIGIAAEHLPRIFDMFMQVDTSLERRVSGLGIGLTLVRNLVELHGGSVEARSDGVGQGSEFILRLPVVDAPPPSAR